LGTSNCSPVRTTGPGSPVASTPLNRSPSVLREGFYLLFITI
jgi:hypothetical protein